MKPLERAAHVLCEQAGNPPRATKRGKPLWMDYLTEVKTVLAAIREPSEPMREAAFRTETEFRTTIGNLDRGYRDGGNVWLVMIDAALAEDPST